MKNMNALITLVVVGTSSIAAADSAISFRARASASWSGPVAPPAQVVVRDHRTANAPIGRPVYYTDAGYRGSRERFEATNPAPTTAPVVSGADCSNWDPTLEHRSPCAHVYGALPALADDDYGRWTSLGARESSVLDHQYITVQRSYRQLRLEALTGKPMINKVAITFMDGTTSVVNLRAGSRGFNRTINLGGDRQINQVVVYTAYGSNGAYAMFAN